MNDIKITYNYSDVHKYIKDIVAVNNRESALSYTKRGYMPLFLPQMIGEETGAYLLYKSLFEEDRIAYPDNRAEEMLSQWESQARTCGTVL